MAEAWVWLASGAGWERPLPPASALGLAAADVRQTLRLQLGGRDAEADRDATLAFLQQASELAEAGAVLCGALGHELGPALERLPLGSITPGPFGADAVLHVADPAALRRVVLPELAPAPPRPAPASWQAAGPAFRRGVAALLDDIGAGRLYQANLTVALADAGSLPDDGAVVLAAIEQAHPAPFAAWLRDGDARLGSGSMERFLTVADGVASSRPIKGTRPRDPDPARDAEARTALLASAKEGAENRMIVDMARHDLGKVATVGGVEVPALLELRGYRTVWHLESEVRARLRPDQDLAAILAATLAPASVTGAPKIAATRRYTALEARRRGPYCGALGTIGPGRTARLAVGIRMVLDGGRGGGLQIPVGAGIVADSDPEQEWNELLWKARGSLAWLGRLDAHAAASGADGG